MGMAASQARFLGLTARKTNVEYEGQQIHQQRTTLANETANYYNQLLGMTVPTPPSSADYTKTVYTFNDGNITNSITSLIAQANGEYKVSYLQTWVNDFAPVTAGSALITRDTSVTPASYRVGATTLRQLGSQVTAGSTAHMNDPYLKQFTTQDEINKVMAEETEYLTMLTQKYGSGNWYVRYVEDTTTGTWSPVFYNKDEVDNATYTAEGTSLSNITAYKMGSAQETREVKGASARIEKDATGRYMSISIQQPSGIWVTYALTTNTSTDQAAYNDAMNQYEYDKYQYDQSIQEINAKIEIIQSQDRNLELRLKQLDTEQSAIQTEMEAVEKIIDKNIDSTFKIFG